MRGDGRTGHEIVSSSVIVSTDISSEGGGGGHREHHFSEHAPSGLGGMYAIPAQKVYPVVGLGEVQQERSVWRFLIEYVASSGLLVNPLYIPWKNLPLVHFPVLS